MLDPAASYEEACARFRWRVPEHYNIGVDICDRHADAGAGTALIHVHADGKVRELSFTELKRASNRLANVLAGAGLVRGDRVAILLPQRPETAIAHIAAHKAGMVSVPLFTLFGEDALLYRLADSGAAALVTDRESLPKIEAIRDRLPNLKLVLVADESRDGAGWEAFAPALAAASDRFAPVDTLADDPAIIIYTSGTTGPPKGALHAHRVLLGHLPGVEFPQEFFPKPGDRFWTPADWAWIGGLIDVLLPSLHHGIPVVAYRFAKFEPEAAFDFIARHGVRNAFLPPTALKMMRQVPDARCPTMRSIGSGGESLGAELLDWGRRTFGFTINEFYGQTECNLVVGNCASIMEVRPGSMGKPIPGHKVAIVDGDGNFMPPGEPGAIAVRRGDPVMFLKYWNKPEATEEKYVGDWMLTGDLGRADEDGYLHYVGRDDDVITSAGYRIGPGEIEDCLMTHPAVALAAAIGVPDPLRTQAVKACIVLAEGQVPSDDLKRAIQSHVKTRLAAHEYPRIVEFVDELPMTTTGKIMRRVLRDRHAHTEGDRP
ncbi:acyl-CoA synthetase [Thalassobaculum sp. OXR-137]|uniref:acyl-CoA synthetase n=1 Tax=Thalassobaculum sp. OXR-137 TaxID=3100173 RepID=UPI002AC90F3E|nr:acyl-CoA synthetase [Thalassobaculum sp. OXR-137]WPZ36287.1 acyl-CoA synthetase [Thalassobaculum sp. OXR-137]